MRWLAGVVAVVVLARIAHADDAPVYGPPAAPPPAAPPPPAAAPRPLPPPPVAPIVYGPPPPAPIPPLGTTFEAAIGLGIAGANGSSDSLSGVGGPALGFGVFVSPTVALGVRMSGVTIIDRGVAYFGTLAPHLQVWIADQVFVAGGIGLGIAVGCPDGGSCDEEHSWGLDARIGYAFARRGTNASSLSLEMTSLGFSGITVHTFAVLVGFQTF